LDPLSSRAHLNLGIVMLALDRHDEAEAEIDKAIELQPQGSLQYLWLSLVQIVRGQAEEAVATAQRESDPIYRLWALSLAEEARRHRPESDRLLNQLIDKHADAMGVQIAASYAQRGQSDEMFKWLDHALENQDPGVKGILFIPLFRNYRNDPQFLVFAQKVGVMPTPG
jgi:tetratricopeptide (TPR) repeat protein